jgi:hypothetical protein
MSINGTKGLPANPARIFLRRLGVLFAADGNSGGKQLALGKAYTKSEEPNRATMNTNPPTV